MDISSKIKTAHSRAVDACQAVQEFYEAVHQPDMALVVFFCSSYYDLSVLAGEMNRLFAGVTVIGCTTAGEIGPAGYCDHSLSGASLPRGTFHAVAGRIDHLHEFEIAQGAVFASALKQDLELCVSTAEMPERFGLMLVDGLSIREETVGRTFQHALGQIQVAGGSAGDDLKFAKTWVYHEGAFHPNSVVLALVATNYPFKIFKTQHFKSEEERLVVTEADVATRTVKEINGLPAAQEYARLVGVDVANLTPADYATMPVVVVIDGTDYVRSIQSVNPDNSLTFYSAIDEGLVFRVASGGDLVGNLQESFDQLQAELGELQLTIACDCTHRNLEMSRRGLRAPIIDIFRANNTVGFSTYGEQYVGVHVNQTLTGVAIGTSKDILI
ncbi:MAG: FIST N-terminal domain-containing protein [Formivibrio sp.]|nr:FIST N-terminal domain-containing protein [Formivibrio sp.]